MHLIRASLAYVNWKERKAMAADLKLIYRTATAEMAELALAAFREKYPKHQAAADVWQRNWQRVILFFDFPEEIRKIRPAPTCARIDRATALQILHCLARHLKTASETSKNCSRRERIFVCAAATIGSFLSCAVKMPSQSPASRIAATPISIQANVHAASSAHRVYLCSSVFIRGPKNRSFVKPPRRINKLTKNRRLNVHARLWDSCFSSPVVPPGMGGSQLTTI